MQMKERSVSHKFARDEFIDHCAIHASVSDLPKESQIVSYKALFQLLVELDICEKIYQATINLQEK